MLTADEFYEHQQGLSVRGKAESISIRQFLYRLNGILPLRTQRKMALALIGLDGINITGYCLVGHHQLSLQK